MLDKTPGISLYHKAETDLLVDCSDQCWLELFNAPFLQQLIVTGVDAHERHISVRNAPQLKQILNPNALPLVLHLDLTEHHGPIFVEGPIHHVDLCWQGGEYLHQQRDALRNLLIYPLHQLQADRDCDAVLTRLEPDSLLVIYAAPEQPNGDTLLLNTLARVAVIQAPSLSSIKSAWQLPRLIMRGCKAIEHLHGGAERARLTACGNHKLCFYDRWENLELVDCLVRRLSLEDGNTLVLRGRCDIDDAQVPEYLQVVSYASNRLYEHTFPSINESTLRHLYELFSTSHGQERDNTVKNLLSGILKTDRRSTYYHSVQLLSLIAQQSTDYDTRLINARKSLLEKRGWTFGKDLGVEGWTADVKLWLVLRERQPVAWLQRHLLESLDKPECFYAVVQSLLKLPQPTLFELAMAARVRQLRTNRSGLVRSEMMLNKIRQRLLLALPRLRERSQRRVVDYFLAALPPKVLCAYTSQLFLHAEQPMRAAALRSARLNPELQGFYTALALGSFTGGESDES